MQIADAAISRRDAARVSDGGHAERSGILVDGSRSQDGTPSTGGAAALGAWAQRQGVHLIAVAKSSDELYRLGLDPVRDVIDWRTIADVGVIYDGVALLSTRVLEPLRGKTLTISVAEGRSYTVLGDFTTVLRGVARGIIVERALPAQNGKPATYWIDNVVHEVGHVVDLHGIKGLYDDKQTTFSAWAADRDRIFRVTVSYDPNAAAPQPGYISVYAQANDQENVAEHFRYYVLAGAMFRRAAQTDAALAEKYNFLRDRIFAAQEY